MSQSRPDTSGGSDERTGGRVFRSLLSSSAAQRPQPVLRYSVALATLALASGLSSLFHSFIMPVPFILFFAAVAVNGWYGGLAVGMLSALASVVLVDYFLIPPFSLFVSTLDDLLHGAVFVASLISSLTEGRTEAEAERLSVTLGSIGDAVIATEATGRLTFLNSSAEALTGWRHADAIGQDIVAIFQIINDQARQLVDNPVARVLRGGTTTGLANHTLLIARDGTKRPIDDSGAPIQDRQGLAGIADGIVARRRVAGLCTPTTQPRAVGYPSVELILAAALGERLQRFVIMDEAGQPLALRPVTGRLATAHQRHWALGYTWSGKLPHSTVVPVTVESTEGAASTFTVCPPVDEHATAVERAPSP